MRKFQLLLFSFILLVSFIYGQVEISNSYVRAKVQEHSGRFSIGETSGEGLLQGFSSNPQEGSHFLIKVNSTVYSNKPGLAESMTLMDSTFCPADSYLVTQWSIPLGGGNIRVWKKLKLNNQDSLKKHIDIEYFVYNNTTDSVSIGFMQYFDVNVNGNDDPEIEIPEGEITSETEYTSASTYFPSNWVVFEDSIDQDTSAALGQGVFWGISTRRPDRLLFTDKAALDTVTWDLTTFGRTIDDLAVGVWWQPQYVPSYGSYMVENYYGAGYPGTKVREKFESNNTPLISIDNYPNPFKSNTHIQVKLPSNLQPKASDIRVEILNSNGKLVKPLENISQGAKVINFQWKGNNGKGETCPNGIYFCKVSTDNFSKSSKLIYLK